MSRIHLFEFEDLQWFPAFLRNYMTDFLQFLSNATHLFKPVVPIIEKGLQQTHTNTIIDLASGGGGGMIRLSKELTTRYSNLRIILTDFYPNLDALHYTASRSRGVEYVTEPVNALDVPEQFAGLRTQFLSFHHFSPPKARKILQNAVDRKQPIAIFEAQERSVPSLIAMFFSPVTVLLTTPFILPFKPGRLLFTYVIPLVPILIWWDGIVSALRTYSEKEMQQLVDSLNGKNTFTWEIGRKKSGPGVVLYLLGYPVQPNPATTPVPPAHTLTE